MGVLGGGQKVDAEKVNVLFRSLTWSSGKICAKQLLPPRPPLAGFFAGRSGPES